MTLPVIGWTIYAFSSPLWQRGVRGEFIPFNCFRLNLNQSMFSASVIFFLRCCDNDFNCCHKKAFILKILFHPPLPKGDNKDSSHIFTEFLPGHDELA